MSNKNNNIEETTAKVEGIYNLNKPIREKALASVWGKYNMLPDILTESLGKMYEIVEDVYFSDKNEKSLFNYTHDKMSVYSRSIAEKNLTVGENNTQPIISETPKEAYNAWHNTAYQGKNYYDILKDYNESFSENTKIIYDDDHTLNSIDNGGYVAIDYENEIAIEYAPLTIATQTSYNELNSYKKPRRKDFRDENGSVNEEKYSEALKSWGDKKYEEGKNFRKNKKSAKDQYIENLDELNSFIREPKTLLTKTSKFFKEKKIESLVTRTFDINTNTSFIDTSVNKLSGRSRGRNLRKKNEDTFFPFCRAWVAHHQYGIHKDSLIRPFDEDIEESKLVQYFRSENGGEYLQDYSVLKNGFVKITPDNLGNSKYDTKRCMFSIENLAWKDVKLENELDKDQIGPNGGRIMWFPPYDLQFQETSQANWNETNFIGRGEPIYTYTNTKRTGTLSFTLLIDHPSIMNIFDKRSEKDDDEDNDILRFFAGCDIPMKLNNPQPIENFDDKNSDTVSDSDTFADESKEITFSVYFPYNYSGHYYNGNIIDHEWVEYILKGHGINARNTDHTYGYEVTKNKGISSDNPQGKHCNKNGETVTYYYRFDYDICSKLSNAENYRDTKSYQLNSERGENTLSFLEFASLVEPGKNYCVLNDEIQKIKNIGDCTVEIIGVVTNQDEINSNKLSERRINTLNDYIKKKINNIGGKIIGEINSKAIIEDVNGDNDVNSRKSKKGRRVDVKIKYNLPAIEAQYNVITKREENVVKNEQDNSNAGNTYKYNESDYFLNLEKIDNFAYQKISEKIKYFDPAYHSISPEGFNSRLTFLHQCTRQGHTLERNADSVENVYSTAGNMAFGRPPFCVLRIGDFINTKILIRSVNIVYQNGNGMQWDMNPEGIGVQPMFAKVTLQIEIIGGQSLDAPVSRLNNAVSFNYYANTGVYDNRADRAIYGDDGEITYSNLYEIERK